MNDLDLASVLRKTMAGTEAIKVRDRALTPKMRMLLIMLDGAKTGAELLKLVPNADETRQLLAELVVPQHHLRAEPHDQQQRFGVGSAEDVVANLDAVGLGKLRRRRGDVGHGANL